MSTQRKVKGLPVEAPVVESVVDEVPSFREVIAKVGSEGVDCDGEVVSRAEQLIRNAFAMAQAGDMNALKFLAQYSEGAKGGEKGDGVISIVVQRKG